MVKNVQFLKLSEGNTQLYMSVCVNFIFKVPLFPSDLLYSVREMNWERGRHGPV